jgi:succinate dehydrogenase/fumarate reductase flavoprotein subunit
MACVPHQHLTGAFVFGEIAAESAVEFISSNPGVNLDDGQVRRVEEERNQRFSTAGRDIDVRDLEYKVRRMIGDYVISPKNGYKLLRWQEWAERFGTEIEGRVSVRNGHELARLYEVENIVQCASLSALASLERKESRWGDAHRRNDYPERDDRNWLHHIILRKGDPKGDVQVRTKAVVGLEGKEADR